MQFELESEMNRQGESGTWLDITKNTSESHIFGFVAMFVNTSANPTNHLTNHLSDDRHNRPTLVRRFVFESLSMKPESHTIRSVIFFYI